MLFLQRWTSSSASSSLLLQFLRRTQLAIARPRSFSEAPSLPFPDLPPDDDDHESSDSDSEALPSPNSLRAYLRSSRPRCLARVREQGRIPAIVTDPDKPRRPNDGVSDLFLSLDSKPLVRLLKMLGKRDFLYRVVDMHVYFNPESMELKETFQVLPRNLNYGPGKTSILNAQFLRVQKDKVLKLGVRIEYLGQDKCPGIRKGGVLKKHANFLVYNCKLTEHPAKIVVDMSVLEIGDKVLVQDLDVDYNLLDSDRLMTVCEIIKDEQTKKWKAKRLKNEIYFKRKALTEKEGRKPTSLNKGPVKEGQPIDDEDDEVDVEDDEDIGLLKHVGKFANSSNAEIKPRNPKQKRRLVGTAVSAKGKSRTPRIAKAGSKRDHDTKKSSSPQQQKRAPPKTVQGSQNAAEGNSPVQQKRNPTKAGHTLKKGAP